MIMISGIYEIKSASSGKAYIGSSNHIIHRWSQHKHRLNQNTHINRYLQNAWNKYGEQDFVFTILEECSVDDLLEREQYYLDQIFEGGKTYNISSTSIVPRGVLKTQEHRDKISNTLKGRKLSEETKLKMSLARKGRIHSQETRHKISKATKGKSKAKKYV